MTISKDPINLIITGVGGQGNILASQLTATAAIAEGYYTSIGETYGASQRGGSVMSHVRFSKEFQYGPLIPSGQADVILGFEPLETLRVLVDYGHDGTEVIMNPRPNYPISVLSGQAKYPPLEDMMARIKELARSAKVIHATELAKELGTLVAMNVIMVGALAGSELLPVPVASFKKAVSEIFDDSEKKREFNLKALELGMRGFREAEAL
ncbi:MAG TPA: indolepyruvate oxidoreductase subunit beta [bacterium]|nr:indolepyruvate oxidoreductase subunit beta [bacterium]